MSEPTAPDDASSAPALRAQRRRRYVAVFALVAVIAAAIVIGSRTFDGDNVAAPPPPSGVTAHVITLGIVHETNQQAMAAAGIQGAVNVDSKAIAEEVIKYVNAHGGIAGRQIEPIYHARDIGKAIQSADENKKHCAAFTEDHEVFAVVADRAVETQCLAQAGVPVIGSTLGASTESYQTNADFLYGPGDLPADAVTASYVNALADTGFFGDAATAKIGVVGFAANRQENESLVTEALSEYGLTVAEWGDVEQPGQSDQDIVLKFKTAGITHVLFPGYGPVAFVPAAETQQYRPKYGISSISEPQMLAGIMPPEHLANTTAVGWAPAKDVDLAKEKIELGAQHRTCLDIGRTAGLPTDSGALQTLTGFCDSLFVLQAALKDAESVTPQAVRAGYEAIGTWDSSVTFKAELGPGHHAGVTGYRLADYHADCECFRYAGPAQTFPGS